MTLQLAIVLVIGVPLVAITQPFLPPFRGAAVLLFVLLLLAIAFWRGATNLPGPHAGRRPGAGRIAHSADAAKVVRREPIISATRPTGFLPGMGSPVPVELQPGSPAVGKTLAQIQLRGLTGATVLAIRRGDESVLVPSGHERLQAGDMLAIAGSKDAVEAAKQVLGDQQVAAADPGQL